jgi:tRNA modification GTPase
VGIVRLSGAGAVAIAEAVAGPLPAPREIRYATFKFANGAPIDQGVVLRFAAPRSYTGEDVVELQGHGGPVVMRQLLKRCVELGARLAQPGEFTQRAFLNGRLDLAQAESVADLIEASSDEAARSAARSLAGEFSARVEALAGAITHLRMHVEACIDFPEEEIDPADRASQVAQLAAARAMLAEIAQAATQGSVLREGLTVVLIGRPNVGKSSLLNRLAGEEVAIVTPVAGTTRDYVKASIQLEGVPIHLVDTAGLRESRDEVERLGIERSWKAVEAAGAVMFVEDTEGEAERDAELLARMPASVPVARVVNKVDLSGARAGRETSGQGTLFHVSALRGDGMAELRAWLLEVAGWKPHGEGVFMARQRHLDALARTAGALERAVASPAYELQAEELRLAHSALGEIVGNVSADQLLGEIFSRFCIGK